MLRTHWGVDDPAHATGTDAEIDAAFMQAYRTLRRRIEAFLALPLDDLARDRAQLKAEMDRIGARWPEEPNMSVQCEVTAKRAAGAPMSVFERYLTVWVFVCIIVGILVGQVFPEVFQAIGRREVAQGQPAGRAAHLGDDHPDAGEGGLLAPCTKSGNTFAASASRCS